MPDADRRKSGFPMILVVAAVLAVVVIPLVWIGRESGKGRGTVAPGRVEAVPGEIRTIPQLSAERKSELIEQLKGALRELYGRAFLREGDPPTIPPSPQPSPATRVDDLFTANAQAALRKDPEVFRPGPVRAKEGRVTFAGVVTLEKWKPVQALLDVEFIAGGSPTGNVTADLRLQQKGTLLLTATKAGWRVAGFGLAFSSALVSPSPAS
ncbi:MAG TPA: hypothetical protein VFA34_03790 [Actinomycetota bacterium]|jgi:hypothetical protein|nr:hypothetical protein [Actinomycetota bacterium]